MPPLNPGDMPTRLTITMTDNQALKRRHRAARPRDVVGLARYLREHTGPGNRVTGR